MKDEGSLAIIAGLIIIALAVVGIVIYVSFLAEPQVEPDTSGEGTLLLQIDNGNGIAYYEVWIDEEKAARGITLWPEESYEYNFTFDVGNYTTYSVMIKVHIAGHEDFEDSTSVTLYDEQERMIVYQVTTREFSQ